MHLIFQTYPVGNQCDKPEFVGFPFPLWMVYPNILINGIHLASAPRHLDRMPDCPLHTAGGCLVLLRDRG